MLAWWHQPVASGVALVPLHWVMRLVSYRRTATASETTGKYDGDYINLREVDRIKLISTLI